MYMRQMESILSIIPIWMLTFKTADNSIYMCLSKVNCNHSLVFYRKSYDKWIWYCQNVKFVWTDSEMYFHFSCTSKNIENAKESAAVFSVHWWKIHENRITIYMISNVRWYLHESFCDGFRKIPTENAELMAVPQCSKHTGVGIVLFGLMF